jgi:5-methylcytosine-specific restriction endonuclease McrA
MNAITTTDVKKAIHRYNEGKRHHVKQLAHGGEDTVENAIAVCPNCHRKAHHG